MFSELNPIVLMGVSKNIYLQVLYELNETRKWAALHVADNCCFHYRRVSSVNCWMILKCSVVSRCRKVPMTEFLFFFQRLLLIILAESSCAEINSSLTLRIYQVWKVNLSIDVILVMPKSSSLSVNALCSSSIIIKWVIFSILNFTIMIRLEIRYFLLYRILMLLSVRSFLKSCFWYLHYSCTNFFIDAS